LEEELCHFLFHLLLRQRGDQIRGDLLQVLEQVKVFALQVALLFFLDLLGKLVERLVLVHFRHSRIFQLGI